MQTCQTEESYVWKGLTGFIRLFEYKIFDSFKALKNSWLTADTEEKTQEYFPDKEEDKKYSVVIFEN